MNSHDFLRIIAEAYTPNLEPIGFALEPPRISGRCYSVRFIARNVVLSVSFEPGDEAICIIIFESTDGARSNADDSPRLSDLNRRYMSAVSPEERQKNAALFDEITVQDQIEVQLVKAAKELCLVLPKHLASLDSQG